MKKTALNVPNTLSLIRCLLVPVFVATLLLMKDIKIWGIVVPTIIYILTGLTDMLDGKIARKYNLITDFGKFLDPVADKFMVIGTMFVILYKFENFRTAMIIATMIVVFRELAVTSMRLVVSTGQNIVVAANKLGKIKTVSQIVAISTIFLEPVLQYVIVRVYNMLSENHFKYYAGSIVPLSWITLIFSIVMTVWSGINYIRSYWKYIGSDK